MRLLLPLLFSAAAVAQELPQLRSRNMPETCEFVYRVESDIRVQLPTRFQQARLRYDYLDVYTDEFSATQETALNNGGAELTLVSFSTNPRHLYRSLRFSAIDSDGELVGGPWISEFARQFGEACHPGGRAQTPWRERAVRSLAD